MCREEPYRVTFLSHLYRGAVEQTKAAKLDTLSRHVEVDEMNTSLVLYPLCLHPSGQCLICASKPGQHLSQHQTDQELVLDRKAT